MPNCSIRLRYVKGVKILVRRGDTGEFYKGEDEWTRNADLAMDFSTAKVAERFCRGRRLHRCHIIVHLPKGVADAELPCDTEVTFERAGKKQ